jgi:hypothetical protein
MSATVTVVKVNTRIHRTQHPLRTKIIRKHAWHTGEIIFAWNTLQASFFGVFYALFGQGQQEQDTANAIWHTIQSDKNQREMLLNAARTKIADKSLLANLKWAIDRANDLSVHRNDPIHTNLWIGVAGAGGVVVPDLLSSRITSFERLMKQPTSRIWRKLRGDLYALTGYVHLIESQLRWPDAMPRTFPARPKLQSLP